MGIKACCLAESSNHLTRLATKLWRTALCWRFSVPFALNQCASVSELFLRVRGAWAEFTDRRQTCLVFSTLSNQSILYLVEEHFFFISILCLFGKEEISCTAKNPESSKSNCANWSCLKRKEKPIDRMGGEYHIRHPFHYDCKLGEKSWRAMCEYRFAEGFFESEALTNGISSDHMILTDTAM